MLWHVVYSCVPRRQAPVASGDQSTRQRLTGAVLTHAVATAPDLCYGKYISTVFRIISYNVWTRNLKMV
uniref:Uncharacterized protein n=1 Tax=Arundo donax TaxID=35708 RepID=A0A0A8YNY4_ARUDO